MLGFGHNSFLFDLGKDPSAYIAQQVAVVVTTESTVIDEEHATV